MKIDANLEKISQNVNTLVSVILNYGSIANSKTQVGNLVQRGAICDVKFCGPRKELQMWWEDHFFGDQYLQSNIYTKLF